jgi:hypothetical protein
LRSGIGKEALALRAEKVERSFALTLDRGGLRRTHVRGRENVQKRYVVHVAGYNPGLLPPWPSQVAKLKRRFGLDRVVLVGDRGMITNARIEADLKPAGLDSISALRAPAIRALAANDGPLQLSLCDTRDMAEIRSPDYPGERLIVCRNPDLAAERARKRKALLAATEKGLARIATATRRRRNRCGVASRSASRSALRLSRARWPSTSR